MTRVTWPHRGVTEYRALPGFVLWMTWTWGDVSQLRPSLWFEVSRE